MELKEGDLLAGRYNIRRILKKGGMGAVYQAWDTRLEGWCAVKEMLDNIHVQDAEWVSRRFREEATILGQLNHPDIPHVRDFFIENKVSYIVMDLIEGTSLEQELHAVEGGLPPERVKADALVILGVLDYLHSLDPPVLHRDVKPANIIREAKTGRVKLVDFGLARSATGQTQTTAGTMSYCSPEQLQGKTEARSDLYSLGATMYHLLTGTVPTMGCHEPLKGFDPALTASIDKALHPAARQRHESAKAMLESLGGHPAHVSPGATRRGLGLVGAAAAVGLFALILLGRPTSKRATDEEMSLVNTTAQATLCLRQVVVEKDVMPRYVEMIDEVKAEAKRLGVKSSMPYNRFWVYEAPSRIDMEVGLVIPEPARPKAPVQSGELPGGPMARMVYSGPYTELVRAYTDLETWIKGQHLGYDNTPWAIYVDVDPAHYRTELYYPLKGP